MRYTKENLRDVQNMAKYKEALFPLPKYLYRVKKTFVDY